MSETVASQLVEGLMAIAAADGAPSAAELSAVRREARAFGVVAAPITAPERPALSALDSAAAGLDMLSPYRSASAPESSSVRLHLFRSAIRVALSDGELS